MEKNDVHMGFGVHIWVVVHIIGALCSIGVLIGHTGVRTNSSVVGIDRQFQAYEIETMLLKLATVTDDACGERDLRFET